jgi:hypothetical protein
MRWYYGRMEDTGQRSRSKSCSDCGDTFSSHFELESHVVNLHTNLSFLGQFIFVRDEDSLKKYCEVRGFTPCWTGLGWYGRDDFQNCEEEWVTFIYPVSDLRDGCLEQIRSAQKKIELIDSLPKSPSTH